MNFKNFKIPNNSSDIIKNFLIILIIIIYLSIINRNTYIKPMNDIKLIHKKIELTYKLVDELDEFKKTQQQYNTEIINYLNNINIIIDSLYYNKSINNKLINKIDTTKNNINKYLYE